MQLPEAKMHGVNCSLAMNEHSLANRSMQYGPHPNSHVHEWRPHLAAVVLVKSVSGLLEPVQLMKLQHLNFIVCCTMRFGSTAKVLLKCKLKYYLNLRVCCGTRPSLQHRLMSRPPQLYCIRPMLPPLEPHLPSCEGPSWERSSTQRMVGPACFSEHPEIPTQPSFLLSQ